MPNDSGWIVDIRDAADPSLCGGKAAGLAKLVRPGFAVPAALCLTTALYRRWLATSGLAREVDELVSNAAMRDPGVRRDVLRTLRARIDRAAVPDELAAAVAARLARIGERWNGPLAVRSSSVYEDSGGASHAGLHASLVVPDVGGVFAAVRTCWASLWTDAAWAYRERLKLPHASAAMAVVVQRFVVAERSGVVFSADPVTGDPSTAVINAGWGAGAPLMSGKIAPDEYRVRMDDGVERRAGRQDEMSAWRGRRETTMAVPEARRHEPVLTESQALELAQLAKRAESVFAAPADVEWVFDGRLFWVVQARPITKLRGSPSAEPAAQDAGSQDTLWTRANLKEVFPDLPSPLALSYLPLYLNLMFKSYHAALGYTLPREAELVSVFRGRPYLNLTLMQELAIARGGRPAVVARLFGGAQSAGRAESTETAPDVRGNRRRLAHEMFATFFQTPARGRRLFRALRRQSAAFDAVALDLLTDRKLIAHLVRFRSALLHEPTLRRLHEVISAQSRAYMALEELVTAWVPSAADGPTLVKRLMTGLGTLPNVKMTYRLMELGTLATGDARAEAFFAGELTRDASRDYEKALAGTRVLAGLDSFLREFGHRGPYESDVMSPRFVEDVTPVLRLIQLYARAEAREDPERHARERRRVREQATDEVRRAVAGGRDWLAFRWRWLAFSIVCNALQRLLALRDQCRHVTTALVAHLRRLALELGRRAVDARILSRPDDVFFLSFDELPRLLIEPQRDWKAVALARRRERDQNAGLEAPDLLRGGRAAEQESAPAGDDLVGFGVSPGLVTGTVKILRSMTELERLSGEIVVSAAIEPTLTPLFPLAGGMIAEMGGLLSHASILAREYGLPAVVSVPDATRRLRDGDRVELDGTTGRIRVLERAWSVPPA
jgi:rifampicin phosphotransferase